jgi:PAS domain S-box-containing protein
MSVLSSATAGGYLARRMILTGMFLPLIIGGLVLAGYKLNLYDTDFRFLLYVSAIVVFFTYIIWRNAKAIHRLDIVRRESEQSVYRLAAIVESSDDAIVGRDMRGVITDWNKGAERLFGYKAEEMIGKSIVPLFPKGGKNELLRYNTMLKKSAPVREYEAERVRKDGSIVPVSITASAIRNSSGRMVGISSISRNISERKQIERQRELFISIASHELKTPVTSTKAYTQLLEKHFEKRNDKESLDLLQKMDGQLNKLTELIGYLLDVSTIQKGQLQLKLAKIDLDALISETIDELSRTTSTHTITKTGKISRKIDGDRNRLTQVFRNVLTNAIKYSPEAKKVEVTCETEPSLVRVAITDYGIGIPKEEQRKVFDPLYRTEGVKKEKYSGLGLGLYITREIVRKHGGHLSLSSTLGKGTTVTITLPTRKKTAKKS